VGGDAVEVVDLDVVEDEVVHDHLREPHGTLRKK
jgi:hypothetical protein